MNCLCVWSISWECEAPPEGRGGGVAHLDGALVFHCFAAGDEWMHSSSSSSESPCLYSHPQPPFSFFNFSSLCPLLNSWLIALHWHAADGNVSGGQAAVVRREFMVESAMSLTLNRLSCNSCMKSPWGPDHPVDFSPIKAIRIFVHQLTNKKPTEADYVAGVLQGGFNRELLSWKQFD